MRPFFISKRKAKMVKMNMKKEYKKKEICLNGDRMLINACRKAGLKLHNPQGEWNGYGYERLPLVVTISSVGDMRKFNRIKKEVAERRARQKHKKTKPAVERYADRAIEHGIIDEDEREKFIELYLENKRTKGRAYHIIVAWYRGEEDDEAVIRILRKMANASYRHNYTDYDAINKRGMSDEEVNNLRSWYSIR